MKRTFCAKIHKFFVKKTFERIKREEKLFETAECLKEIVCWLTKIGTPPSSRKIMVRPQTAY